MKFLKPTCVYIVKNIGQLLLLCIVPAIFVGALLSPFKIVEFFNIYSSIPVVSFNTIFQLMLGFNWLRLLLFAVGITLLVVFVSAIFGYIENHMRSGKKDLKVVATSVNNNVVAVIANVIIMILVYVFVVFLLCALVFLFHLVFSGLNNSPSTFNVIFTLVLMSGTVLFIIDIFMYLIMNIPNMIINGYPLRECFSITIKQISKNSASLWLAFVVPLLIIVPLVCLCYGTVWIYIVNIIGVLFLIMYWCSLSAVAYFDLSDTPRYDNRKYYNMK